MIKTKAWIRENSDIIIVSKDEVEYTAKKLHMRNFASSIIELSLLSIMDHPNIIKPIVYIPEGTSINIVMDNLYTLRVDDVRGFIWDMLSALDYMHKNDIIHGDIKPSNILTTEDGTHVIIDFESAIYTPIGGSPSIPRV